MKGKVAAIPNELILIDTFALQEAKALSQVENIITTNDELYRSDRSAKRIALWHHQFESIHPFYDGNGRTGRILNLLHLVLCGLLDLPILDLSRYIVRDKTAYYRGLQNVRDTGEWENWILYMLRGIEETARETLKLVEEIRALMIQVKQRLRTELPKLYSQDLLNNLFRHPYTKIEFVGRDLGVKRLAATKYLNLLHEKNFVRKIKFGHSSFYSNEPLVKLLSR